MSTTDTSATKSATISASEILRTGSPKKEAIPKHHPVPHHGSSLRGQPAVVLEPLPSFNQVPKDVWPRLVSQKLSQIKTVCEFGPTASQADVRNQEVKTQALHHMLEYLGMKTEGLLSDANYPVLIEAFVKNVLRPLPPATNPEGDEFDPEEDEDVLEPSWPHLSLTYEMFVKFLELPDFNANIAKKTVDQAFVIRLMILFDGEDPRERDMVKTTLHRVYGKFLHLRPVIRRLMRSVFMEVICEGQRHKIAEMLEILGSVINGFALPIREEHRIFLEKTLVPLHKARTLPCFFQQLCFCVTQFVEKDPMMSQIIIPGLLRIWPKTNTTKEVLFLGEFEEILLRLEPEDFEPLAEAVFDRLGKCIASQHFQVAEKALMFWHNTEIMEILMTQHQLMIFTLTPYLLRYSAMHWSQNVRLLIVGVIHTFIELDSKLFEQCADDYAQHHQGEFAASRAEIAKMIQQQQLHQLHPPAIPGPQPMDISSDDASSLATASDSDDLHHPPGSSSMRRKSVLPMDAETAAALATFRPSPPPEPLKGDDL